MLLSRGRVNSLTPQFIAENKDTTLTVVLAAAVVAWLVFGESEEFAIRVITVAAIWGILAISLNLIVGYTGLLSIAHLGFFGFGAYISAVLTYDPLYTIPNATDVARESVSAEVGVFAWNFFASLPLVIVITGVGALFVGIVFSRFRDDFFALATLGVAVIAHRLFLSARDFTRGPFGINWIPSPSLGGWVLDERWEYLVLVLVTLGIVALITLYIVNTSFGRVLTAIREDEKAIEVFGYRVVYYKLTIWVTSAMIASVAGALFVGDIGAVSPNEFVLLEAILLSSIVLIGGLASIWGSIMGALVFVLLEEGLRFVPGFPIEYVGQARIGVLGALLVILMLFRPQGLIGRYKL